ncbi:hypothetical protein J6590_025084 [Homalodisca vitripennis]|nr:hypothetical protein J6590_025084 [Homalodisca vitripennis]
MKVTSMCFDKSHLMTVGVEVRHKGLQNPRGWYRAGLCPSKKTLLKRSIIRSPDTKDNSTPAVRIRPVPSGAAKVSRRAIKASRTQPRIYVRIRIGRDSRRGPPGPLLLQSTARVGLFVSRPSKQKVVCE